MIVLPQTTGLLVFLTSVLQVYAACPLPEVNDEGYSEVVINTEEDLRGLLNNCSILNANLGISVDNMTTLTFPGLTKITGYLGISDSANLKSFEFPDLTEIGDYISITNLSSYAEYDSFPNIVHATDIYYENLPALKTYKGLTNLKSLSSLSFNNTGLETIDITDVAYYLGYSFSLVNNTNLQSCATGNRGSSKSSIYSWGQPREARYSFPQLTHAASFQFTNVDGSKVSAPSLQNLTWYVLDGASSTMPDTGAIREVEVLYIVNSQLDNIAFQGLNALRHLIIENTTVGSHTLDLGFLETMNEPTTIDPNALNIPYDYPPGSNIGFTDSVQEWQAITVINSTIYKFKLSTLDKLNGSIAIDEIPGCFPCQSFLTQIEGTRVQPKYFNCDSTCEDAINLDSHNWTSAATIYGVKPHKGSSVNKAAIIGGAVGGGVGLVLILALAGFFYRRRRSGRHLDPAPSIPAAPAPDEEARRRSELHSPYHQPDEKREPNELDSPRELRSPAPEYELQG